MTIRNPAKLLALSEREFKRESDAKVLVPATAKFKGMKIDLKKFGHDWDRKRGAAVRMTTVLLRENDETLERRVCADSRTYGDAVGWLEREARNLRKTAHLVDNAVARLSGVLGRCSNGVASQ